MEKKEENYLVDNLTKYLSNELTDQEKLAIDQSIADTDDQKHFEKMKRDIDSLEGLKYMHEEETNIAWSKLQSRIQAEELKQVKSINLFSRINLSSAMRIAASVIVLIGLSWLTYNLFDSQTIKTIETADNKMEVTLPDGTQVSLNAHSSLSYPTKFENKIRKVTLSGEAFFDVVRNTEKPFIIDAKDAEITVLGTSFNVVARDEISGVDVVVSSGAVSLSSKISKTESLVLAVGDMGILKENKVIKTIPSDINYLSWKTQIIDFRNSPLSEVVKVLNNTYTANIKLDTQTIGNLKLTSKYDHMNLDTIIRTVCIAFDLKREDREGQIILKKSNN